MMLSRRRLFGFALAAPAIVAAPSLMRVSTLPQTLTLDQFTAADLTMSVEDFAARYLRPQMIAIAKQMDAEIMAALWRDGSFPQWRRA